MKITQAAHKNRIKWDWLTDYGATVLLVQVWGAFVLRSCLVFLYFGFSLYIYQNVFWLREPQNCLYTAHRIRDFSLQYLEIAHVNWLTFQIIELPFRGVLVFAIGKVFNSPVVFHGKMFSGWTFQLISELTVERVFHWTPSSSWNFGISELPKSKIQIFHKKFKVF